MLNSNSKKTGLGYQEVKNGAAFIKENSKISIKDVYNLNYKLQTGYKKLIGNGAYIFKPKSIIFRKLLEEQERRIYDAKDELVKYPGNILGDNHGYPLPWTYILGDIFHPIIYLRRSDILQSDLVKPILRNYR